ALRVFGRDLPYCRGRAEIYPLGSVPGSAWSATFAYTDLAGRLARAKLLAPGAKVTGLEIDPKAILPSERLATITVRVAGGK
ncbi:hypothetical protein, partial [Salmonella enterica]|uniref:hypothetical protein n=1 Tax=Salmonella enterica TaxID=28901 RepID=UPI003D28CD21